jgi:enamine deaminase RidA (YjgF/YER057c/UK114 family)
MERLNISSGSPYEPVMGFSRAVRVGQHVFVAGTAPVMPEGEELPPDAYGQTKRCLEIIVAALSEAVPARARRPHADLRDERRDFEEIAAHTARVFGDVRPACTYVITQLIDPRWRVEIEAEALSREAGHAAVDHRQGAGFAPAAACSTTPSARATRTRSASRRSTCSSTRRRFDLVQHIDTVLAAVAGHELEERINAELMQSVIEITTPVCRTRRTSSASCRAARVRDRRSRGEGLRVGSAGTHPFSLFERQRITARDRYRNLVDQMQYVARRELIFGMHVHVAVDGPEKAIQVVNGLLAHLAQLLALSASSPFWRGEPTGLASSRQMVFAAFPRSGRRRASATTTTTRRSSASSSAPAASPTTRTSGGTSACTRGSARSRSGSATRSRASRTPSRSPRSARRS